MANILYGVAGEGMGHAIRSRVIIDHLRKKHKVTVASANNPYEYLSKFYNTEEVFGPRIISSKNKVSDFKTAAYNLLRSHRFLVSVRKLVKVIRDKRIDLVITDFEPFSCIAAKLTKKPLISIDNINLIAKCILEFPEKYFKDYLIAKLIINAFVFNADYYLITSFFCPKVKYSLLFAPILRKEIIDAKPNENGYILVYQTYPPSKLFVDLLKKTNQKFIFRGCPKNKKDKNIVFRKFSDKGMIKDLANCKAVIANGGFTVITEAIHLGKPVLSLPVRKHFEQLFNSIQLDRLGYGMFAENLDSDVVKEFISKIDYYKTNLKNYKREDNSRILKKVDELIFSKLKFKK